MARSAHARPAHTRRRSGQAMVESVIVLFFLCLVFFLLFDYARLLISRTTLDYAAQRCARARAVGFNDFMVLKTAHLGTLAVAGECRTRVNGRSAPSTAALVSRMGSYLQAENPAQARGILDFPRWSRAQTGWICAEPRGETGELTMRVWQKHPLFGGASGHGQDEAEVTLWGEAKIENHYPFYLQ